MGSTHLTAAAPHADRRAKHHALAGTAASIVLHAALLGVAWAAAPALAEAENEGVADEQPPLPAPPPQAWEPSPYASCIVAGWCLASATWSMGVPIPGSHWEAPPEVRGCFGDDGEPGVARTGARRAPAASRVDLGALASGDLPWRTTALAIGAAAGGPEQPTLKIRRVSASGTMSREDARSLIELAEPRHRACYERALRDKPWLQGRVQVKLTQSASEEEDAAVEVTGTGGVEMDLTASAGIEQDDALMCCLRGAQQGLIYGMWGAPGTVRYTLELHPGGR